MFRKYAALAKFLMRLFIFSKPHSRRSSNVFDDALRFCPNFEWNILGEYKRFWVNFNRICWNFAQ